MPLRSFEPHRATHVIALASLALLLACSPPHATLTVPASRAAPSAERLQAFERYRPAATSTTVVIQSGAAVEQRTDFLVLADGTRVYHAEDLGGAVFPDSATARAAERSRRSLRRARMWSNIGWAAFGVGLGLTAVSVAAGRDVDGPGAGFTIGIGVALAGGVLWVAGMPAGREAQDEKLSAFTTYEADLRTRLDLCVKNAEVVDCRMAREQGTPAPAPAAPAPAAPAVPAPATTGTVSRIAEPIRAR